MKDYIVQLGLDAVKDKCLEKKEEIELKKRLEDYIGKQNKINEFSTREEELDFEAVSKYIKSDLIKDVQIRLFGEKEERASARATIIAKAIDYSQAHTNVSRNRAVKLVENAIDILRGFYKIKANKELRFIAAQIEDTITRTIAEENIKQTKEIIETIKKETQAFPLDKSISLMRDGRIFELEEELNYMLDSIKYTHVLSPHYGFVFDYGKRHFISKPLTDEARIRYPEKISCTGSAFLNGKPITKLDYDIIDYANRHQLPIVLNVDTAKKFLGDFLDPIQHEAEGLVGNSFTLPPKPFPPAMPCSILLNGEAFFEYVLFRTEEILDDGTIIISNREQLDSPYIITIKADLLTKRADYIINVKSESNKYFLHYLQFLKVAYNNAEIVIKVLSSGAELTRGQTDNIDYSGDFETIEDEIDFLNKVIAIENYYETTINLPDEISYDDYKLIDYMATLIQGGEVSGKWTELSFSIPLTEDFKQKTLNTEDIEFTLSYVCYIACELYGQKYELPAIRQFESVRYKNLDRLKQKVDVLDLGDDIKISFLPGNGECGSWKDKEYTK